MTLNETLHSTMQEYARQFGQLIKCDKAEWITDGTYSVCMFDQRYYFMAGDIITTMDTIDKQIATYGDKETVGKEILAWYDWLNSSQTAKRTFTGKGTLLVIPTISLARWLQGERETGKWETFDELLNKWGVLYSLSRDEETAIGENSTIKDAQRVIESRIAEIKSNTTTTDGNGQH